MITKKLRYNIITTIILSFLVISLINPMEVNAYNFNISAKGAVLIDVDSGRILYEKNSNEQMRIASLTKIMTAIVAIENSELNEMVKTSSNAYGVEGSSIYLRKDEELSLENMLYGLMLRSGNDAAVAIAEHVGGSIDGFAYLMNEKAMYLGMNNTHFVNSHGLDVDNHYSTPKDMAILTAYALKNPIFKEIVSTKIKKAPLEGEDWDRTWYNKNKLLYRYQWADGVKTGYTKLAQRCLASSATKDDMHLAIITLNAPDDWNDHVKLFEYGFNSFSKINLAIKDDVIGEYQDYTLVAKESFTYLINEGEENKITKKVNIKNLDDSSISFFLNDKYIGSVPVVLEKNEKMTSKIIDVWIILWKGE